MKEYTPTPIDTSGILLPRDLYKLMEELAKHNHDIWASRRISEGWSYGRERNDEKKETPCLVNYDDLPENEKEYDRNTSSETLKSIYKLGFEITKHSEGKVMLVGSYSKSDVEYISNKAKELNLSVAFWDNWENAQSILKKDLTKWNSIILDSFAKLYPNDEPSTLFLRDAIDDINSIFHRNYNEIPWYILPNSHNKNSNTIIKYTVGRERYTKDWGKVTFNKETEITDLLQTIKETLPNTRNYRMQCVYGEMFEMIDLYFPVGVKTMLFDVLLPLHYPEVFYSFSPVNYYNNLRRIIEATYIVCYKYGIIPGSICYSHETNGSVHLTNCTDYIKSGDGRILFPQSISSVIDNILSITNEGSHMGTEYKTLGLYHSITSFSLQLCDVIMWVGRYIQNHKCISIEEMIKEYEGMSGVVQRDNRGYYYIGKCVLPYRFIENNKLFQKRIILQEVTLNNSASTKYYPLFAKSIKKVI